MKRIWALALAIILALSVSAFAAGARAEETITLNVWVNGGEDAFIPTTVEHFYEEYPNIRLDLLYVPQEDCFQKLMTTIASGGQLPDFVDLNLNDVGQLMSLDMWEDLSQPPYNFDENNVAPLFRGAIKNERGEVVTLGVELPVVSVIYERNLAKEYFGTDDPGELSEMFKTNEDYIARGRELAEKSGGEVFLFSCPADAFGFVYSQETQEPLVKDGVLNIDKAVCGGIRFACDLYEAGALDLYQQWSNDWVANISGSNTMLYFCPAWFTDWGVAINDTVGGGRWGMMMPPEGSVDGGEYFMLPKATSDEKKLAAYTFMNWLCATDSGAAALFETNKLISAYAGNLLPGVERYQVPREEYGGEHVYELFISIANMDSSAIRPLTKYDSGIYDSAQNVLPDIVQGVPAEELIEWVKEDIANKYPEIIIP